MKIKRFSALLLTAIALFAVMTGCDNGTGARSEVKEIAKNPQSWVLENNGNFSSCSYAVTDLDQNGEPEIIADYTDDNTKAIYMEFLVFGSDGKSFAPCKYNTVRKTYDGMQYEDLHYGRACYYDAETGEYHYTYTLITIVSAREKYTEIITFSLKGDEVTEKLIATQSEIYNEELGEVAVAYKDAEGNELDEEGFKHASKNYFSGFEQKTVDFGGFRSFDLEANEELKDMSSKELQEILSTSYNKFTIS